MHIKNLKKETDFKHLNLFSVSYQDRKGNDKSWVFASRSRNTKENTVIGIHPDAVVVVPFHRETGKVIIIREFRVVLGGYQYGFPAGLVDKGETIHQAAARELKEETGLDVTRILKWSPPVYSSSGMTDESVSLVWAECTGEISRQWNEDSEDIHPMMLSREDAHELIARERELFDVKTWILLSLFAENGMI